MLKRHLWNILGLAEVRWTEFGETTTDEGHKIWYCGEDSNHQYGVAFIVRKEVVGNLISCIPTSSRLKSIRISVRPHKIAVIQVYAITSDHEDEVVKRFYKQLDSIIPKTLNKYILLVQGDWNAKVGPDAYQHWAGTVGRSPDSSIPDLGDEGMVEGVDTIVCHTFSKECENYSTIRLISHPSKIMLRVILNRLEAEAEELLAEEQAGFRRGRSTVEQTFNSRVIVVKHLRYQRDLFHKFIDFKKAFDIIWPAGLRQVFRSFNINEGLV